MACILKTPISTSKGVITFTTQEWRVIRASSLLTAELDSLRSQYVLGLHFNWHDYQFDPPQEFDFFMAGEDDLRPINDKPYRLLPMDACNFTPSAYHPIDHNAKHWDVLIVGNPVYFKRPEIALQTIRDLFNKSNRPLNVLYICPIPKYSFWDEITVLYDIREYYESLFSLEERARFTLLTTTFDSPNPFDRRTLSVFFKNSKVFLHCATEERRCRIAAYAWCAGLPVVAYPCVGSILPADLRVPTGFYNIQNDKDYAVALLSAIENSSKFDPSPYRAVLSEDFAVNTLENELIKIFKDLSIPFEGKVLGQNLDRRLGWHHQGIGGVSNGLQQSLLDFMKATKNISSLDLSAQEEIIKHDYPERVLAQEFDNQITKLKDTIASNSIYLNPLKRKWLNRLIAIKSRLTKVFN
jgi:hypothetical protein